jgi:2-oxo-4-hydroxy-4-carboxy-5-ureidoimidazoline decarboxylase
MPDTNPILAAWNTLDLEAAADAILPCNGSAVWATLVAYNRPYETVDDLAAAADHFWQSLPEEDWQQAFDSHPRIGERQAKDATEASLAMSANEQSAANPDALTLAELAAANQLYEQTFGRIFIVCATGKSAAEMLAILRARLANDPATELLEAAEQQRQITQIRLRKWLATP